RQGSPEVPVLATDEVPGEEAAETGQLALHERDLAHEAGEHHEGEHEQAVDGRERGQAPVVGPGAVDEQVGDVEGDHHQGSPQQGAAVKAGQDATQVHVTASRERGGRTARTTITTSTATNFSMPGLVVTKARGHSSMTPS